MRCIWLLVLLWGSLCLANSTLSRRNRSVSTRDEGTWYMFKYFFRPGATEDDPISLAKKKMALDAYYEAVDLADLAYDELAEDDPIYKRYFRSNDFQLVKEIYGLISGALDGNRNYGSPDITELEVYEGSYHYGRNECDDERISACLIQNLVYPEEINFLGLAQNAATMSTCNLFYDFHLLAERKCKDIFGDNDNVLMTSRGSILLHELTHWRTLNMKSYYYTGAIREDLKLDHIFDYAYGAFQSHLLVASLCPESAANADNYAYYTVSKYWQQKCPKKNGGQGWETAVDDVNPRPPASDTGRCKDAYDVYDAAPQIDCTPNMAGGAN